MTTLVERLRKALEALEADDSKLWPSERRKDAITALRAEIARLEAAEPVAWLRKQRGDYEGPAPMAPLLILGRSEVRPHSSLHGATYEPLYTAPTPPAAIPALTDDEVKATYQRMGSSAADDMRWAYALAAERARVEIKEEGK